MRVPFDEIERSRNPAATGRGAGACFEDLAEGLRAEGFVVDPAGVGQIGAAMWSVLDNKGKPPAGDASRLADALGRHWPLIARTILDAAQVLRRAGVGYSSTERELAPLATALVWRLMWWQWSDERTVTTDELDANRRVLDDELVALLPSLASSEGWPSDQLELLADDWSTLKRTTDVAEAVRLLLARSRAFRGAP